MAVFFTKTDPFKDRKDTRERNGNVLTLFLNPLPFTHVTCPSSCKALSITLTPKINIFCVTEGYNVLKKKRRKKNQISPSQSTRKEQQSLEGMSGEIALTEICFCNY